ncbi:hypothetical protein SDC9_173684 [bioreactor metagenome]|uniref:Uncharacterized protein n=1 Tax=bioreactor metagenome TaxID=1076179 RepID=A0A645GJD3_9ZZZZ
MAIAQHIAGRGAHLLQRLDGFLSLALLIDTQDSIEQHDDQDDDGVRQMQFTLQKACQARHRRRDHQDDQHRLLKLLEETLKHRCVLALFELIASVCLKPRLCFLRAQPSGAAFYAIQNPIRGFQVIFHFHSSIDISAQIALNIIIVINIPSVKKFDIDALSAPCYHFGRNKRRRSPLYEGQRVLPLHPATGPAGRVSIIDVIAGHDGR